MTERVRNNVMSATCNHQRQERITPQEENTAIHVEGRPYEIRSTILVIQIRECPIKGNKKLNRRDNKQTDPTKPIEKAKLCGVRREGVKILHKGTTLTGQPFTPGQLRASSCVHAALSCMQNRRRFLSVSVASNVAGSGFQPSATT